MSKIPTAEEFLIKACIEAGFTEEYAKTIFKINSDSSSAFVKAIIEFAQLHVEAALEAAAETKYKWHPNAGKIPQSEQSKQSILSAYPLENIQ